MLCVLCVHGFVSESIDMYSRVYLRGQRGDLTTKLVSTRFHKFSFSYKVSENVCAGDGFLEKREKVGYALCFKQEL